MPSALSPSFIRVLRTPIEGIETSTGSDRDAVSCPVAPADPADVVARGRASPCSAGRWRTPRRTRRTRTKRGWRTSIRPGPRRL
ncbi:hypothetical protein ID875_27820 [Streptomyces globisporus]|uniref:Uncharacterized protein n=1 Tax=Streptomyces globisporus TaxID=1908 RepID=A0A927GPF0_STRGL|nr:hypothetical protein [Streptomyces globisporus]